MCKLYPTPYTPAEADQSWPFPDSGQIDSLTGLTSFGHLLNIEYLDLSRNQIDSLRRELRPYLCNASAAQT